MHNVRYIQIFHNTMSGRHLSHTRVTFSDCLPLISRPKQAAITMRVHWPLHSKSVRSAFRKIASLRAFNSWLWMKGEEGAAPENKKVESE